MSMNAGKNLKKEVSMSYYFEKVKKELKKVDFGILTDG